MLRVSSLMYCRGLSFLMLAGPTIAKDFSTADIQRPNLRVKDEETLGDGSRSEQSEDCVYFESEKYPTYANSSPVTKVLLPTLLKRGSKRCFRQKRWFNIAAN